LAGVLSGGQLMLTARKDVCTSWKWFFCCFEGVTYVAFKLCYNLIFFTLIFPLLSVALKQLKWGSKRKMQVHISLRNAATKFLYAKISRNSVVRHSLAYLTVQNSD